MKSTPIFLKQPLVLVKLYIKRLPNIILLNYFVDLLGNREEIVHFVTQALEGTVKYPSRSEYNMRKQYQD